MKTKTMEKIIASGLVIGMATLVGIVGYAEPRYIRKKCKVISIENNVARITENRVIANNIWEWEIDGLDNLEVGDIVDLKMHTNGTTDYIYDDIILKIVKKG